LVLHSCSSLAALSHAPATLVPMPAQYDKVHVSMCHFFVGPS
jgi:hypothetical protein